jgi:hypothetical protein
MEKHSVKRMELEEPLLPKTAGICAGANPTTLRFGQ